MIKTLQDVTDHISLSKNFKLFSNNILFIVSDYTIKIIRLYYYHLSLNCYYSISTYFFIFSEKRLLIYFFILKFGKKQYKKIFLIEKNNIFTVF